MITDFIKRGKDNVVEIIKENTGLLLDVVNPGPGNTGTSTQQEIKEEDFLG